MLNGVRTVLLAGALTLLGALPVAPGVTISAGVSPRQLEQTQGGRAKAALLAKAGQQNTVNWWRCLGRAVNDIRKHGAGGYSTGDDADVALQNAFEWNERLQQPVFHAEGARPSFCSGAVYAAMLSALAYWDSANNPRRIRAEAWQALMPVHVADGVGAWGQANANGPGLAVMVHRLGAGVNFTEWEKARPGDIMKMWWNDEVGAKERGHLVIFVKDLGEAVQTWSSHQGANGTAGGFGFKTFRKKDVNRVLFTRITNPAAFNKAPKLGTDEWLGSLLRVSVSWEECLRRAGVAKHK